VSCTDKTVAFQTDGSGSIKAASRTTTEELLSLYNGTKPGYSIGLYGDPYQWWESGAVWSGLIDYQAYTSDVRYTSIILEALLAQVGPNHDYQPPDQTSSEVCSNAGASLRTCRI